MKFQKIIGKNKIHNILDSIKKTSKEILIWKLGINGKVTSSISLKAIRSSRNELVFEPNDPEDSNFQDILSGNEIINLFVVDEVLLFQSLLVRVEKGFRVSIRYPEVLMLMDRRENIRLNIPENIVFSVDLSWYSKKVKTDKNLNKKVFDISVTGLSFILNKEEKSLISIGDRLDTIVLYYEGKSVELINSKVATIQELNSTNSESIYECYKVGLKFQEIDDKSVHKIKEFMFSFNKEILL